MTFSSALDSHTTLATQYNLTNYLQPPMGPAPGSTPTPPPPVQPQSTSPASAVAQGSGVSGNGNNQQQQQAIFQVSKITQFFSE